MYGVNNPSYVNGSSYNKRCWRGHEWERIRVEVYKRDKYVCQDCGVKCTTKKENKKDTTIQCHHVEKYNGENNNLKNLITLCLKCHLKRHKK